MQVGHSQYLLYISCREGGVRAHAGRAPQYLLYISCREGGVRAHAGRALTVSTIYQL